jgi:hypothetical protein
MGTKWFQGIATTCDGQIKSQCFFATTKGDLHRWRFHGCHFLRYWPHGATMFQEIIRVHQTRSVSWASLRWKHWSDHEEEKYESSPIRCAKYPLFYWWGNQDLTTVWKRWISSSFFHCMSSQRHSWNANSHRRSWCCKWSNVDMDLIGIGTCISVALRKERWWFRHPFDERFHSTTETMGFASGSHAVCLHHKQ